MTKPLYSNAWVKFENNRAAQAYTLTWLQKPNLEEAQKSLSAIFKLHLEAPQNWIIDTRELEFQDPQIDHWIFSEWLPKLISSGVDHIATIIPQERYLKLKNTDPIQPFPQYDFTTAYFYHNHDARNYLKKALFKDAALSA